MGECKWHFVAVVLRVGVGALVAVAAVVLIGLGLEPLLDVLRGGLLHRPCELSWSNELLALTWACPSG